MAVDAHRLLQTCRYGIVDANLREEIPDHWAQAIIAPDFLGDDTGRSPILIQTDTLSDEDAGILLDRLASEIDELETTFFSLLLEAEADIQRVARHLANRLVVQLERNGRPMQLRYYDPGTFVQLPGLLGEAGMNWLLGPINAVTVPWAGEFTRYEKPIASTTGFGLASHLPVLLDLGIVNRAALQLDPPANQLDWIERCGRIRTHVRRARERHHLASRDDLIAFALHAETCHPRFDEHAVMRTVFARLTQAGEADELEYRDLTMEIEPEIWTRIARDLTENNIKEGITS